MAGEIHLIKKVPAGRGRADCDGSVRGCSESEMAFKRKAIVKKKKNIVTIILAAALCLLITACSSEIEKLAVSDQEYADYAGAWFRGKDPWGGDLSVMIKSIVDGKMEWTFTDSFDQSTLYQEMKETVVQDHAASFDVQGNDAENRNTTFQYQGTMELKDGTVVMTFESGAVMTQQDGPPVRDVKELADAGRVTLEKPDESELNTYTVKQGDSLHSIAEQYGISTKDLAIMNQTVIIETAQAHGHQFDDVIEYARYLFPGEVLIVPAAVS